MGKHHKHRQQSAPFIQEGQFLRFLAKQGEPAKRLQLSTPQGELTMKVAKVLRPMVVQALQPGDWIQVSGAATMDRSTPATHFKVTQVRVIARPGSLPALTGSAALTLPPVPSPPRSASRPQTILVCQKSDCVKRGGKAVCQALAETLEARHLGDRVVIKGTGCMHQCKAGPHVVMPDKQRYTRVAAKEIPAIVAAHFPAPAPGLPRPLAEPLRLSPDFTIAS